MIAETRDGAVHIICLNDPARRNALSRDMLDALEAALMRLREDDSLRALLLRGNGPVFCAGFDLQAAVDQPPLMAEFIQRLSRMIRALRRLPIPVVAAAHGAAIAGGCALLSACDFVVMAADCKAGYPVHRIGVSPAVTLPTLMQAVVPGAGRALVMSGDLIDRNEAKRIGLASHLAPDAAGAFGEAKVLAHVLASRPPFAMRVTKEWLNELDGSSNESPFNAVADASAALANAAESVALMQRKWGQRS